MNKTTGVALLTVAVAAGATAQVPQTAQTPRIEHVLVYPGGAMVVRRVPVKAGQALLRLPCLSARFDADTLQVTPEAGIALGDIAVQTVERAAAPECASSPLDARIRELEDQIAAVGAEISAHELALGYLKQQGPLGGGDKTGGGANIAANTDTLRRSGLDNLQKQIPLQRRKEELARQLAPLSAERDRLVRANPKLRSITIRLASQRDGELRLSYRLAQAGWEPVYRAYLDTATGKLRLERHAQVAQNSGEDWTGVKLRLSTAQPNRATDMRRLQPWRLDVAPPAPAGLQTVEAGALVMTGQRLPAPPPAFAPAPAPVRVQGVEEGLAFDVNVFRGEFATEFEVPGQVTVAADGQRIALALGSVDLDSQVLARANPAAEAMAYLVAVAKPPAGVWPQGAMQLFRDGAFIGQSHLSLANLDKLDLYFGRDEQLRVSVEPEQRNAGATGFISSRAEHKISHVYRVENLHQRSIAVELLEPSPVAQHEDIKVLTQFNPQPADTAWRKEPGVVAWTFNLEPGQAQTLRAGYEISYPKDAKIRGLR